MTKKIETITDLQPDPQNANQGSIRGHSIIETSVRQRGAGRSGLAAADGTMIAGSQTLQKMAELGIPIRPIHTTGEEWVVVIRDDIEPGSEEAQLLALEDNRATEVGLVWEPSILAGIAESGVDLSGLFTADEWADVSMPALVEAGAGGDEFDATPEDGPTRTALGELWVIGGVHRLLVGDCTDAANVARLMGGEIKGLSVIADPPYGMNLDTDYTSMSGSPRAQVKSGGRKHMPVIGDDKPFDASVVCGVSGAKEQFWFGADYYLHTLPDWRDGSWLVWDKRIDEDKAEMFGSHFELIWTRQKHKRRILRHLWAGVAKAAGDSRTYEHPTTKSVLLIEEIINHWCGGDVYDPFLGSGTTMIAAHNLGRRCFGCEIEPRYADVILRRAEAEGMECERVDG